MEALLVFDPQNNLISTKCNQQFLDYLFEFSVKNGFKPKIQDNNNNEVLRDLLSLLVTPFVVSQKYLIDVSEIQFDCIPNMKAVYYKNSDLFLLYIFENSENPILMQRKVNIFAQIIQFISGPFVQCFASYHSLTQIVFKMIEEWNLLSQTITFMLESVERLMIGSDLIKICENTLQQIFTKIKFISKFSNETANHIYLFYGLKYITTISGQNKAKISRGDMLLMVLLSNSIQLKTENDINSSEEYNRSLSDKKQTFFESFTELSLNKVIKRKTIKTDQYLVFLTSSDEQKILVPHIYRKITIEDQLFVLILSEIPTQLSSNLIEIINIINNLLDSSQEKKCCHLIIELKNRIKKVKDFIIKNNKEKSFVSLLHNLNQLNKCQIFDYIIKCENNILNFQTEAQLSSLNNAFRHNYKTLVFDFIYNSRLKVQTLDSNLFNEIVFFSKKTFTDYLGFLKVKSQRNITLLGINVDIEDLIGFIYIDRTVNELIIAPIESNTQLELSSVDINNIIINMIYKAYEQLIGGNVSHIWSDNTFQYSYALWFEDSSGKELEPRISSFSLDSYPSIIGGNFIQDIINACFAKDARIERRCHISEAQKTTVSCYPFELFTIYKSDLILNEINANKNTKKLSNKLWEIGVSSHF